MGNKPTIIEIVFFVLLAAATTLAILSANHRRSTEYDPCRRYPGELVKDLPVECLSNTVLK